MRKMARYDFIINSQEFQIFARPQGLDVEKSLNKLPKLTSAQLYDRLKEATMTDDSDITEDQKSKNETKLDEFGAYIKKAEPFLKKLKDELASSLSKKQLVMQAYAGSTTVLSNYEANNLAYYSDNQADKLVFNNTEQHQYEANFRSAIESLRNPFTDLYHWCKGEIYDLSAFQQALSARKVINDAVKSLKKTIAGCQADIDNIAAGKKTMSTMFKSSNDVGSLQNKLELHERDLEAQERLEVIISQYLGNIILPQFKQEKMSLYGRILQQFHVVEINNAH